MKNDLDELDGFVLSVGRMVNWLARKMAVLMMIVGILCILYWLWEITK